MGSSAEELVLRITGDSAGGQEAIKGLEERVQDVTTALGKSVLEGMGPMGAAAGIAALATASLGTSMMELGQHATETVAKLQKVSLTIDTAVPALVDLEFALDSTGGSLEQLNTEMFMFEQRIVNSSDKVDAGLRMIGLSLGAIEGMSHDQQMLAISDAFRSSGEEVNKAAAAMDIFGRSGRTILPQLMQPLADLAEKSKALGTITAEAAEKAHEFEIAQKTMAAESGRAWTELGLAIAPATNTISLAWDRMKVAVANVALTAADAVGWLAQLGDELNALSPNAETSAAGLERLGGELPKVAEGLKGLADGSGLAAKGVKDFADRVKEYTGHAPSIDEALDNEKESIRDLDSETKNHIETLAKHKTAVDALVAGLEGESKKSGDVLEAITLVIASHTEDADTIQRVVDQIDKLYDRGVKISDEMLIWADANRVVKGSLDNIGMKLSEVGLLIPENTAHIDDMRAKFDDVRSAIQGTWMEMDLLAGKTDTQEELDAKWKQSLDELNASLKAVSTSLFESVMQDVPHILERAFTGAGGASGAVKAIGSDIGKKFGQGIQETLWTQMGTSDDGGNALTHILGDKIGGALTTALPGIGAVIGPLAGKLFSMIAGIGGPSQQELDGRKVEGTFESQFGSFQKMMDAVGAAYAATGRTAQQAQADVKALMDAEKQGGAATQAMADQINAVLGEQQQDAVDLDAAVKKYGFSIAELGPTMQKQQLDQQAKELLNDWRLLVGSGMDIVTVDQHMASTMQTYLTTARQTGQEVPIAMQPIIQKMIDQGLLTDENGKKITDMKDVGVTFAETMTQGFEKIVAKLDQLLTKIGMIPAAAAAAADGIPQNPFRDWQMPDVYPDGNAIPMVDGGIGRVTRPTLFLAGEAGDEDVAFSGGGKRFGPGLGGGVTIHAPVTVMGNVLTEEDLSRAVSQHIADAYQQTGGSLPLNR